MTIHKLIFIPQQYQDEILNQFQKNETLYFNDTYFDLPDYQLLQKNTQLRKRNQTFELIKTTKLKNNFFQQNIINDVQNIKTQLNLKNKNQDLENNILLNNFKPFVNYHTHQTFFTSKHLKLISHEFDFDSDFKYQYYSINSNSIEQIESFLLKNNIPDENIDHVVIAYIKEKRPQTIHFD